MKPFDKAASRISSVSPTVIQTIKTFSPAAAKIVEVDAPLLIRVAMAAMALNKALAQGRTAYAEQGELNRLIVTHESSVRHRLPQGGAGAVLHVTVGESSDG